MVLLFPGSHAAHARCVENGDGIAVERPQTAFDVDFGTGELKFDDSFIFLKQPLSKIADAFEMYKTPGTVKGKILVDSEA